MAALDDVGKAAWRAELAKRFGRYALRPAVQALLADHLAANGEALNAQYGASRIRKQKIGFRTKVLECCQ